MGVATGVSWLFQAPTSPSRFATERWSHETTDRNLQSTRGGSSPLVPGRAMPNECRVQREATRRSGREDVLHAANPSTVGAVRRDPHGNAVLQASVRMFTSFEAPSRWAASWPQAGTSESHGGFSSVMYRARVATIGEGALRVARISTEPPRALDVHGTYEVNRSRRCDRTRAVRELHLSLPGEAVSPSPRAGGPMRRGRVPRRCFRNMTATIAVERGTG